MSTRPNLPTRRGRRRPGPRPSRRASSPLVPTRAVVGRRGAIVAVAALLAVPAGGVGQEPGAGEGSRREGAVEAQVERLSRALLADQRAHLRRVAVWGGLNLVGGSALALASDPGTTGRAFGVQSAGWGGVNVAIAAWGLLSEAPEPSTTLAGALEAEDGWSHLLLVNLGLNVGYAAVGGTLLALAGDGASDPDALRGHGAALVLQGAGLFALDWLAWRASGRRLEALRGRVGGGVGPGPVPGSTSLTVLSVPLR